MERVRLKRHLSWLVDRKFQGLRVREKAEVEAVIRICRRSISRTTKIMKLFRSRVNPLRMKQL